jgi:hypothetical protein
MLRRILFSLPLVVCVCLAPAIANAGTNGFVIGLEGGYGSWGLDASTIKLNDATFVDGDGNEVAAGPALQGFVQPINEKSNYSLNLHLGWNVLGYASVEAAIHATSWDLMNKQRGGAGFVGGRATIWPMQFFLPKDRKYDAGLEFGVGYSIAGGPTYGMSGTYVQFGIGGEYLLSPFLGVTANIRHFAPYWSKFYTDFDNNIGTKATSPDGGFTTFTVGINLHVPMGFDQSKDEKK